MYSLNPGHRADSLATDLDALPDGSVEGDGDVTPDGFHQKKYDKPKKVEFFHTDWRGKGALMFLTR